VASATEGPNSVAHQPVSIVMEDGEAMVRKEPKRKEMGHQVPRNPTLRNLLVVGWEEWVQDSSPGDMVMMSHISINKGISGLMRGFKQRGEGSSEGQVVKRG